MDKITGIKNIFAIFSSMVFAVLFFCSVFSASAAGTITLEAPVQDCLNAVRVVDLSWTSDLDRSPTFTVLRKKASDTKYTKIGDTSNLTYQDDTALSDQNYQYQIKVSPKVSNEVTADANYCPAKFKTPEMEETECKNDGPRNNLSWVGVSGAVLKYEIYRKNETAGYPEFSKIGEVLPDATVYSDGPEIIGTNTYSYFIRAVWQDATKSDSETRSILTSVCPPVLTVESACNVVYPGGPKMNLSWNNLLGVVRYEIYRKAQSEESYILLASIAGSTVYADNLVESLPLSYWNGGNIAYFVKAIWVKDAVEISQSSLTQTRSISLCAPFVSVAGMCDAFDNPEMHINWTRTNGADLYNLYRDSTVFIGQLNGAENSYVDYLNSATCPGSICAHSYRNEASVTGFSNFISNTASQNIDCATVIPPSPAPVLSDFNSNSAYCESNKSKISLSWSSSSNAIYYTLYRNSQALINLSNTSYIDAGVESGIDYVYSARAFGKSGTSSLMSDAKNILAVSCVSPAAPVLSLAKSCSANMPQVNLIWSVSSANNIVNYEIKQGLSAVSLSTKYIVDKTIFSKLDNESVNPSTVYYYQVIANSVLGVSPSLSLIKSIITDSCLPTTPAVTLSAYCETGNAKVKVSWTSDKANTDHFEIFRQDISGGIVPIATIALSGTSYSWTDPNPTAQTTSYNYKVVAVGQLSSKTSTQGYKSITTYDCALPDAFTLTDPPNVYCQGSYPRADLNWSASSNATPYDLISNLLNNDDTINSTKIFTNVFSPYPERGYGNALKFDGSNDYVSFSGLPVNTSSGAKTTVEFWMNWSGQNYVMPFGWDTNYGLWFSSGCFGFNTGYSNIYGISSSGLANRLAHIVAVFNNGSNTDNILYIDGVKQSIFACLNNAGDAFVTPGAFVSGWGYGGYRFNGTIDEFQIYNRVLSDTEAMDHYKGIYDSDSGLIGFWHFDEGAGQVASNSINNENNGVLGISASADYADPLWISNGLQTGNKYNWQVRANGPGGVVLSNLTSSSLIPVCEPTKLGLEANTFCQGGVKSSVRLKWSYAINTDKYEIYRDGALIKTVYKADSEYLSRIWDDNNNGLGLNSGVSYSYYIKAVGPTGLTNQSNSKSENALLCVPPDTISSLTATPSCSDSYPRVSLDWADITNTDYYTVYRNGSPLTPNATISSFTDTTVAVNTYYTYQVTAYGPGGSSAPSNNAIIDPALWPNNNYCTPSTPVITSISGACSSNVAYNTINWSDATTFNTQQYKIYRNTVNNFSAAILARTIDKSIELALFNSRSWQDSGLLDDTDYYYWVKAFGPVGGLESAVSLVASRKTNICTLPSAPSISLSNICSSYNDPVTVLNWNKTANTTDYTIYKNTVLMKTINSNSSGYIKNWLIIGGFTYSHAGSTPTAAEINTALATDYLGGETSVKPRAGKTYGGKTWFEYSVPSNNLTDFTLTSAPMSALTPKTYASAYAFAYLYSPVAQAAQLRIGSDDGVKAFLNGSVIYTNTTQRDASPDQDIKSINLVAGMNYLLIKVQQGGDGWGLYARITDASGNDILNNITAWDSAAVAGLSKDYNVSSVGPGGTSIPTSNMASSAPLNCNPLTPEVTLTSGCDGANTQVTLSWPADSNTYYWNIYKKRSADTSFALLNPPGNIIASEYVDMNVASNVSYDYYAVAYASGGINRISDVKTALVLPCYDAPIKPVITVAPQCAGSASRIKINWAPYDNSKTLSFNVWRKNTTLSETDFTKIFENLPPLATEFIDGNVLAGNDYIYRMEAIGSGSNNSSLSDINSNSQVIALDCLNLLPFNPPIVMLNYVDYTIISGGETSLGWTDSQNETKYKVFRRIKGETQFAYLKEKGFIDYLKSIFGTISNAAYDNPIVTLLPGVDYIDSPVSGFVNYIDRTASENTIYEYQVSAINNAGGDDAGITYSNIISPVIVPIALPAASALSYSVIGPNKIRIQWVRPIPSDNEYTSAGGYPLYEIQKSSALDFSSYAILGTKCSNIIYDGSKRACDSEVPGAELNYVDDDASAIAAYYRVITENYGGSAPSNIVSGSAILKWREVMPR